MQRRDAESAEGVRRGKQNGKYRVSDGNTKCFNNSELNGTLGHVFPLLIIVGVLNFKVNWVLISVSPFVIVHLASSVTDPS